MRSESERLPSTGRLWFTVLIGAAAWSAQLLVDYVLVGLRCATGAGVYSWGVTAFSILMGLLAGLGLVVGYQAWKRTALGLDAEDPANASLGRAALMAIVGWVSNIIFVVLIIGSLVPNMFMDPCARVP
jgi:hypothetical protein